MTFTKTEYLFLSWICLIGVAIIISNNMPELVQAIIALVLFIASINFEYNRFKLCENEKAKK